MGLIRLSRLSVSLSFATLKETVVFRESETES